MKKLCSGVVRTDEQMFGANRSLCVLAECLSLIQPNTESHIEDAEVSNKSIVYLISVLFLHL